MRVHVMHVPGFNAERDETVEWYRGNWPDDVCVHADPERRGVLWNHETIVRCMATKDVEQRWSLCVQDDALPLAGAIEVLPEVLFYAPSEFVSLCHFSSHGEKLLKRGFPFGQGLHAVWGQAVAYRRTVIPAYLDFVHEVQNLPNGRETYRKWDDGLMGVFNALNGTTSAFTTRALFQHADTPSVMGHVPGRWRHARATMERQGPPWGSVPRSGKFGTTLNPQQKDLLRVVKEHRGQAQ